MHACKDSYMEFIAFFNPDFGGYPEETNCNAKGKREHKNRLDIMIFFL